MKEDSNRIKNAFPSYLSKNVDQLYHTQNLKKTWDYTPAPDIKLMVNNELLQIPYRIDLIDENDSHLSTEKYILDCYLSRHSNGYLREKHLRNIIRLNTEWVIPYVMILLGEYVSEILDVIYEELDNLDPHAYINFIENNTQFFYNIITGRVASYFGRYYCSYIPKQKSKVRKNYVGFKILKYINKNFLGPRRQV